MENSSQLGCTVVVRSGEQLKTSVMWQGDESHRATITLAPATKAGRGYARIKFGNNGILMAVEVDLADTAQVFDVKADYVQVDLGVDNGSAITEQSLSVMLSFETRHKSLPFRGRRTRYVDNDESTLIQVPQFATAVRSDSARHVQLLDYNGVVVVDIVEGVLHLELPLPNDCVWIRSTGGVPHSLSFDIRFG